jgi:hypothetical protein
MFLAGQLGPVVFWRLQFYDITIIRRLSPHWISALTNIADAAVTAKAAG